MSIINGWVQSAVDYQQGKTSIAPPGWSFSNRVTPPPLPTGYAGSFAQQGPAKKGATAPPAGAPASPTPVPQESNTVSGAQTLSGTGGSPGDAASGPDAGG